MIMNQLAAVSKLKGFVLYETNDVFIPQDYGLSAGDIISVVCVGGGASGAIGAFPPSSTTYGNPGQASSFGDLLTAPGGTCDDYGGTGGAKGGFPNPNDRDGSHGGAGGWYPFVPEITGSPLEPSALYSLYEQRNGAGISMMGTEDAGSGIRYVRSIYGGGGIGRSLGTFVETDGSTKSFNINYLGEEGNFGGIGAKAGRVYTGNLITGYPAWDTTLLYSSGQSFRVGGSGAGYGAGSGGAFLGAPGGASGHIRRKLIRLSNSAPITVTVGAGGAGRYAEIAAATSGVPPLHISSGDAADGCVCISW